MNERLKEIRNNLGLNQIEFGEGLSLTRDHISRMEKGTRSITTKTINMISKVYGVNKEWLLTGKGEMFNNFFPGLNVDEDVKKLTQMIFELEEEDREVIINLIEMFNKKINQKGTC